MEGGENIKPANWLSVSNIIQLVRPRWSFLPASTRVCARDGETDAHTMQTDRQLGPAPGCRVVWLSWGRGVVMAPTGPLSGPVKAAREERTLGKDTAQRPSGLSTPAPGFHFIAALSLR